jgi:hypothetical protein
MNMLIYLVILSNNKYIARLNFNILRLKTAIYANVSTEIISVCVCGLMSLHITEYSVC